MHVNPEAPGAVNSSVVERHGGWHCSLQVKIDVNGNLKCSAEFKEPLREALWQKSSVNICADNVKLWWILTCWQQSYVQRHKPGADVDDKLIVEPEVTLTLTVILLLIHHGERTFITGGTLEERKAHQHLFMFTSAELPIKLPWADASYRDSDRGVWSKECQPNK